MSDDETCHTCRLRSQCVKTPARKWCSRYKNIKECDTGKFKLFECRRNEDDDETWMGAVIVCAENEEEATRFANENDHMYGGDDVYYIKEMKLVKGVIYDDFMR